MKIVCMTGSVVLIAQVRGVNYHCFSLILVTSLAVKALYKNEKQSNLVYMQATVYQS